MAHLELVVREFAVVGEGMPDDRAVLRRRRRSGTRTAGGDPARPEESGNRRGQSRFDTVGEYQYATLRYVS